MFDSPSPGRSPGGGWLGEGPAEALGEHQNKTRAELGIVRFHELGRQGDVAAVAAQSSQQGGVIGLPPGTGALEDDIERHRPGTGPAQPLDQVGIAGPGPGQGAGARRPGRRVRLIGEPMPLLQAGVVDGHHHHPRRHGCGSAQAQELGLNDPLPAPPDQGGAGHQQGRGGQDQGRTQTEPGGTAQGATEPGHP